MPHRHRFPLLPTLGFLSAACTAFLPTSSHAGGTALEIRTAADLVSRWEPDQHLYVKGDIGIPAARLAEFETWLDENAPNWTIVLMRDAKGESYREPGGSSHSGLDAVEFQLGQQLPAATGFGKLANQRTGELNGAFFILFLNERKFSYFASDAYDRRRLGEDYWIGNLDRPAISAMRGGGRIIDAAKDTVQSIDSLLDRRIQSEIDAEKRAKESARQALEGAESLITYSQERTGELRRSGGTGDLAENPYLGGWHEIITVARDAYNRGEFAPAKDGANSVEQGVRETLKALEDHREAPRQIEKLENQLASFKPHPQSDRAAALANRAKILLQNTTDSHRRADSAYASQLAEAGNALRSAGRENESTDARLRNEARAAAARQKTVRTVTIVASLGLIALLWGFNRRRREWKIKAHELLANWDRNMDEKRDALFVLLDRTTLVVGSSGGADDGSLEGETLRLAKETVRDVDELFIMSSSVDKIIDRAESLAKPKNPLLRLYNIFAASRYKKAIRLLQDEPVAFSPDEPLRLIIRGRQERGDAEKLLGKITDYAPFSLSFTELIAEFERRARRSLVAVDLLETSWEEIAGALDALENLDSDLENAEAETAAAANIDHLFALPAIREILIPAVEDGKLGGAKVGRKDPVEALRTWIPATRSQADEGLSLCRIANHARAEIFPKLESASDALRKLGRLPHWIGDTLTGLSIHANDLAAKAAGESIFEEAEILAGDVADLGENAEAAVSLAKRADAPAAAAIAKSRKSVASTRKQLARKLGIPVGALLSEDADIDPSRRLDEADIQVAAAQAAIDRGGVLAAEASLDEADRLVVEAGELTRITGEAFAAHTDRLIEQRHENSRLETLMKKRGKTLAGLRENYAPSALLLESGHASAGESVADFDKFAADALADASHAMIRSEKAHASGRILEGASELEHTANQNAAAQEFLDDIRNHAKRIASVEKQNQRDLDSLQTRIGSTRPTMEDPKIMVRTRKTFIDAIDRLDSAAEAVAAALGRADPFAAAGLIDHAKNHLDEVDASIRDDRRSHAEAARSLTAAAAQLDDCRRLVRDANTDRIPDSRAITEAGDAIDQLISQFKTVSRRIDTPHGDWPEIQSAADQIGSSAARAAAILRSELDSAQSALAALERASRSVRSATGWRGSYGIRISGRPGTDPLQSAQELLRAGNYRETLQFAGRAAREADSAVSHAEAQVAAKRREERRQAEEARRRQRQRSSSFSKSSFSSRRSSGGFSSRRSSSGSSRSSFSRGSGTSRSGW